MAVTPEERERMNGLCKQIQEEKDQKAFGELVSALDALLDKKEHRLSSDQTRPAK